MRGPKFFPSVVMDDLVICNGVKGFNAMLGGTVAEERQVGE